MAAHHPLMKSSCRLTGVGGREGVGTTGCDSSCAKDSSNRAGLSLAAVEKLAFCPQVCESSPLAGRSLAEAQFSHPASLVFSAPRLPCTPRLSVCQSVCRSHYSLVENARHVFLFFPSVVFSDRFAISNPPVPSKAAGFSPATPIPTSLNVTSWSHGGSQQIKADVQMKEAQR